MISLKKIAAYALLLGSVAMVGTLAAQESSSIVTIVKLRGETWFVRMAEGVKAFGEQTPGVTTDEIGPGKADAAQQETMIEDLVAKKVGAVAVVPFDPPMLEGVLKRAMDRGIKVVTHEASNLKNTQVDMEAFDNTAYGAHFNDKLAACMGEVRRVDQFRGIPRQPDACSVGRWLRRERREEIPKYEARLAQERVLQRRQHRL